MTLHFFFLKPFIYWDSIYIQDAMNCTEKGVNSKVMYIRVCYRSTVPTVHEVLCKKGSTFPEKARCYGGSLNSNHHQGGFSHTQARMPYKSKVTLGLTSLKPWNTTHLKRSPTVLITFHYMRVNDIENLTAKPTCHTRGPKRLQK